MNSLHQNYTLFAISFLLWSLCIHSHTSPTPTPSIRQRFRQWMSEHNKTYSNPIEREERFQIFQENVKFIDAFNSAGNRSYTLGLNHFTDLTNEERIARFTGANPHRVSNSSAHYKPKRVNLQALPNSWDWRARGAVTPVKTQLCGNCWAFAGVANVESVNFIATGKLHIMSEQEIMDCDDLPGKGGCQGGWEQEVYEYVKHYSLTTEANYPNRPESGPCDVSKKERERVARVSSFVNMPQFVSDEEMMQAVVKQPLVVDVDTHNPAFGGYKSGVFTGPCESNTNHVLQIVGFGETPEGLKYWIARNSWGPGWGEGGYIRIQMGTGRKEGLCGVNLNPSYPIY